MEKFASEYVNQYPLPHWLSVYGLIVVGGLIGWVWSALSGRRATLGPVPFFVRLCLAILIVCVVEIVSIKGKETIAWNVATRLAILLASSSLICGVYIGRIAAARSQDAFGHLNGTPLVFIPIANLLLVFTASETRTTPRFGLMHGEEGAVFGLILLVLAGGAGWTWSIPRGDLSDVLDLMKAANVAYVQKVIREDGLEKALDGQAEVARKSPDYSSDYYYAAAEVEKDVITFTLKAREPGRFAGEDVLRGRRSKVCEDASSAELLKAGATFRTLFVDSGGHEEATVTTMARDCAFPPSLRPWWTKSPADLSWPTALTLEGETANERALHFLILPDSRIWGVSLGLMMLGGLGAAAFRSKRTLGRASYFLGNCVLVLVATVSWALLIPTTVLVTNGHMGFMAALWALVQVACGAVLWRLAAQRSREVHGHAKAAALAFVPVANVWLLVAPPLGWKEPTAGALRLAFSAGRIVSVLAGLALLGGACWVEHEIEQGISDGLLQDGVSAELWIQFAINKDGIEKVLENLANTKDPEPQPDEAFTQSGTRAVGLNLYETWISNKFSDRFAKRQRDQLKEYHCSAVGDVSLMKAGATLHHVYVARSGRKLGTITVSKEVCGL